MYERKPKFSRPPRPANSGRYVLLWLVQVPNRVQNNCNTMKECRWWNSKFWVLRWFLPWQWGQR